MIILLTGGTGFFGKALLRRWVSMEDRRARPSLVVLLSRNPDLFLARYSEFRNLEWLRFHQGDVLQPDSLPRGLGCTHVLHAATDSTFGPQLHPIQRYNQIVDGTRNLLDYSVANGVQRFLLTSSGGVYGPQQQTTDQIAESHHGMPDPLNPANAYSVAKRCAEHLCALYQDRYGLETVVARCFAFVGRDLPLDVHFAIGNFIRDALQKPEILVSGDGTPVRSYMDQRDLAEWLCALLKSGAAGQAYNVGSDVSVTIHELAHLVRDILAPAKPVRLLGVPDAHNTRNRYVPSIAKAQNELGLRLRHNLHASVNEAGRHVRM